MTELKPDQFEMRRLESLSNTIFGVAMTLLAYDLPKAAVFTGAPGWSDLAHVYSGKLAGFALSFIIAGCSGSAITGGWRASRWAAAAR
ncbi:putative membrane protein [Bradyrhizobium diazoefficiens]